VSNLSSVSTTVTTSATLIATTVSGTDVSVLRNYGSVTVFLGGPDVTEATGFPLLAGESVGIPPGPTVVYGITPSATADVRALG
jgi:hypothetical protein